MWLRAIASAWRENDAAVSGRRQSQVRSLAWSPDGGTLAVGTAPYSLDPSEDPAATPASAEVDVRSGLDEVLQLFSVDGVSLSVGEDDTRHGAASLSYGHRWSMGSHAHTR